MDLEKAKGVLAVRIFEWAQRLFLQEAELGYPLLTLISKNNCSINSFILWSNSLPIEPRREMTCSLIRLSHPFALKAKHDSLNATDFEWQELKVEGIASFLGMVPPMLSADEASPDFRPINPDECLDQVVALVPQSLGRVSRRKSLVVCTREILNWKIYTEFRFDRRAGRLEYSHLIFRNDGLLPSYARHGDWFQYDKNILGFAGIYPATEVEMPSKEDIAPMVKALVKYSEFFISAAEPMFEGLGIDD